MSQINKLIFQDEPLIRYERVLCPACKQPACPQTNCTNPTLAKGFKIDSAFFYTPQCRFRKYSYYNFFTNCPVSQLLIERLELIQGLAKISVNSAYEFQVWISPEFNEDEVRSSIIAEYKKFVKELKIVEARVFLANQQWKIGIRMPNNKEFYYVTDTMKKDSDSSIFKLIAESIEGAKFIETSIDLNPPKSYT